MTSKPCSVSALILAGGKATRLGGVDKSQLVVDGRTIMERQLDVLRGFDVIISSPRDVPGHRTVSDAVADGGPLAGIAAGLAAARTEWLLVLAGDMPYLTRELVERLVSCTDDDTDAVGIRIGGLPEPLVCVLRVSPALPIVQRRLASRDLKASRLLSDGALRVKWLDEGDLRQIDPTMRLLFNVNVPEDLE